MSSRPLPVPDTQSAPFWAAAAEHVLTFARCSRCGELCLPPDVSCPHCHSTDPAFSFDPVEGRGTVRTWTVIRQSFLSGFDVPFVLVDVQFDDHPHVRIVGRLLDGVESVLRVGDPVRVCFEDLAPGVAVPAFTLAAS